MQLSKSSVLAGIAIVAVFAVSVYVASRPAELATASVAETTEPVVRTARPAAASPASTPGAVAQSIADVTSGDARRRAAAITALADAPRTEALPVLKRVLTDGEPQVDRPLALNALKDLALKQGDADGAVRDAVRHALYHGDDQTRTEDMQAVLDAIEASELR